MPVCAVEKGAWTMSARPFLPDRLPAASGRVLAVAFLYASFSLNCNIFLCPVAAKAISGWWGLDTVLVCACKVQVGLGEHPPYCWPVPLTLGGFQQLLCHLAEF